jgi:hypothetical protein
MRAGDEWVGVFEPEVKIWAVLKRVVNFEVSEVGFRMSRGRLGVITPILNWSTTRSKGSPSGIVARTE